MNKINFYDKLEKYRKDHPTERLGQAAFNLAYKLKPREALQYQNTIHDPFYHDERTDQFIKLCFSLDLKYKNIKKDS